MAIAVFVVHILRSKDPQAVPLGTVDDCTERRFAGTTRGIEAICHTLAHAGGVQTSSTRSGGWRTLWRGALPISRRPLMP
eukprot:8808809-Pyramimonas_sp.AAC.1